MTGQLSSAAAGVLLALAVLIARPPSPGTKRLERSGGTAEPPQRAGFEAWVCASALLMWGVGIGVPLVLGAVVAALIGRRLLIRRQRKRSALARSAEVSDVVFALASELRAGRSLRDALSAAAGSAHYLRADLEAAAAVAGAGGPVGSELLGRARDRECPGLQQLASVLTVAASRGAAIATVLDRLGDCLDEEAAASAHVQSMLAGPRATAVLLAGLPIVGLGLGQSIGASPLHLLVHRPVGWALSAAAVGLDAAGVAWTRRIISASSPSHLS